MPKLNKLRHLRTIPRKPLMAAIFAAAGGILIISSSALNPNLPGDVNNDNVVNISDLSRLLSLYNGTSGDADFNGDGKVNISDLSIQLSNWGRTYSPTPGPNPNPGPGPTPNPNPGGPACGSGGTGTVGSTTFGSARTFSVAGDEQFRTTMAAAQPGDVIELTGDYKSELTIAGRHFSGAPVVVRAASGANIRSLSISDSSNVEVMGMKYGPSNESTLLKIANATGVKVLRNTFDHKDITVNQSSIVITGASKDITIACNEFRDKNKDDNNGTKITGSYIKFQYDGGEAIAKNVHIYKNYFRNITPFVAPGQTVPAGDSDREAIAMGIADSQSIVTNNIVEYNLFEDTDGENEIITVKTSKNTFRYNTFKNSMGSLSIRFGADSIVENNYFYGSGASASHTDPNYQTGGIRTYGTRHILRNNFMKDLTGDTWRLPILVDSGDTSNSTGGDGHQTSTNLQVTGNTIVNSNGGVHIGSTNYGNKPSGNSVTNNTVSASKGILFNDMATGGTWTGNKAYATGGATAVGGTAKSSAQVQLLTAAPSITEPSPLTPSNVGINAP